MAERCGASGVYKPSFVRGLRRDRTVVLENPAGEIHAIRNPPPSVASISAVSFGECASGFDTEWLKGFRDERASEPLPASRVSL